MERRRVALVVLAAVVTLGLVASVTPGVWSTTDETETDGSSIATPRQPTETAPPCPTGMTAGTTNGPTNTTDTGPRIVELYPNPTIDGNVGEYLVLETASETSLENWTITDGHTVATLPNETVSGRVAVSADPNVTKRLTDDPVLELEGTLRLAVDGDDLVVRNGSTTVDAVSYDRAPVAERWYRTADEHSETASAEPTGTTPSADGGWHPRDATCLPVSSHDIDEATAFVLPDAPALPRKTLHEADNRLLLAGYTFTSSQIADALVAAADRGVDVAVLLESGPVGGTPQAAKPVLETLEASDVDVRVIGGEGARYRYHHPKYAIVDDTVLVTSENWKPSGIGGGSSRGWGVRLEDEHLAADLATVFRADHGGWDTESGANHLHTTSFVDDDSKRTAPRTHPTEYDPMTAAIDSAELLVAPDNAERRVTELLAEADDEILVKQTSIDGDVAVLEATVDAARRGVDVKILLDATWYHEAENEALVADLQRLAAEESLPLEARLVEETDRFGKIHAKGVVIDREVAVIGSANWNGNAFENNREVLLAVHGTELAAYYAAVFNDDWEGNPELWTLPFGISATVVAALVLAALVGRRYVRFGEPRSHSDLEP
ncbi:phospholipase D-like domain-containing protein [Natronorubrum thiooxidans]|uniref:Phosphatidylserine/phosphatidylglycerophosphate/cardiolipin synthase n=1 Tax=Natronorubrum thiooxidans TaxID=308853 RepID=A0A1N7EEW1_9EURY|nr:phospholipase D-like domain-containing protein [Natronorubrum thiooxidans]SIR86600.1 Phosphatidylserine/phosphatidylglycerophosphate/cardiolipin synthase [Natronorubrum thiooxidans]